MNVLYVTSFLLHNLFFFYNQEKLSFFHSHTLFLCPCSVDIEVQSLWSGVQWSLHGRPVSALPVQLAAQHLSSPCTPLGSMINFEAIAHREPNQHVDTDLVTQRQRRPQSHLDRRLDEPAQNGDTGVFWNRIECAGNENISYHAEFTLCVFTYGNLCLQSVNEPPSKEKSPFTHGVAYFLPW